MAIESFKDKLAERINSGEVSKQTRKLLPAELHKRAQIKLAVLGAATSIEDLRELRGNRFEALKGNRAGQFSIRSCLETRQAKNKNDILPTKHTN